MVLAEQVRCKLSPAERAALEIFLAGVRERLGDILLEARLFGSRARGDGNDESDVDVALVVTELNRPLRNEILDLAYDIGLEHGVLLAPLLLDQQQLAHLRARERLIADDLDRQGIML